VFVAVAAFQGDGGQAFAFAGTTTPCLICSNFGREPHLLTLLFSFSELFDKRCRRGG
jgi:hypothetical protein